MTGDGIQIDGKFFIHNERISMITELSSALNELYKEKSYKCKIIKRNSEEHEIHITTENNLKFILYFDQGDITYNYFKEE